MAVYSHDLELLRVTRSDTLHLANGLTQKQADFPPGQGSWSVGEVLDHLLLTERQCQRTIAGLIERAKAGSRTVISSSFREVNASVAYIPKRALPFLEVPLTVFTLFIPPFIREIMTEFPVLPAQHPDISQPRRGVSIGSLREALRDSYARTAALLDADPGLPYRRMRYRHPLTGDCSVPGLLRIVAFHERRHQGQIRAILERRDFPPRRAA